MSAISENSAAASANAAADVSVASGPRTGKALADRAIVNKRIRELRKAEKDAADIKKLFMNGSANDAIAGRGNNAQPAAFESVTLSGELAPSDGPKREISTHDIEAIRAGYHANWLPDALRRDLWDYTLTRQPYFIKFRGHDVKTRPKINFADPSEHGEYPLYRWGQERQSYDLVERIPPPVRAVMDYIEARFGNKTNLAMAAYYWNGKEQYIPIHCDKKVTSKSEGRVETAGRIFNISLGAVRNFLVTSLSSIGKIERADMHVLADFSMQPGDLYVLEGNINKRFGHGVARDPTVKDLRVSWVFRTADACFVNPMEQTFREAGGKSRPMRSNDRGRLLDEDPVRKKRR